MFNKCILKLDNEANYVTEYQVEVSKCFLLKDR